MLLVNTEAVPGRQIEVIEMVVGTNVWGAGSCSGPR